MGFGVYYLFFKPTELSLIEKAILENSQLPQAGEGANGNLIGKSGGLPSSGNISETTSEFDMADDYAQGGKTKTLPVFENRVGSVGFLDENINYYNLEDNKFYSLPTNGNKPQLLSDKEFFGVSDVEWANDGQSVIIFYPDGNRIYYDFSKDKQITLNKGLQEPDFSDSGEVAFKNISNNLDENWIIVTNPSNGQTELVESMGENADFVDINWSPDKQIVATYYKPIGLNSSEVFFIDLASENLKSLVVDGSNFKGIWSPDGRKIVYEVVNSANRYNPTIFIVDARGEDVGRHKFNLGLTTWVDKCTFSGNLTLYCAVPRELIEGAGLYPELITETNDLIYKINLITGTKELLADPIFNDQDFSIEKIKVDEQNKKIYFVDSLTGGVYEMKIK
jgi:hypothetical protein